MKEYRDMTIKEFLRVLFFSLITLICVSIFIVLLLIGTMDRFDEREFTSITWKANKEKRIEMIDDLIDKQLLDGLSKQEVITALGAPNESDSFSGMDPDLLYYLGPDRGFVSMDSEWLLIWLNDDNFVEKYEIDLD